MERGNVAGNQMNALLGLGGSQFQGGRAFVDAVPGMDQGAMPGQQPNALSQFQPTQSAASRWGLGDNGSMNVAGFSMPGMQNPNALGGIMPTSEAAMINSGNVTTQVPQQTPQQAAQSAFDIFRNSTNYQNRLNSAMDAVTSMYSGIGGLQSGAAIRGAQRNASNLASEELMNYFALLGGQQATGAGAASSLAGVGQNFAGTVIGANNFNAQNQMNAQLGQQNALANVAGILGGGLFSLGGRR
jgi:hypothetical protein